MDLSSDDEEEYSPPHSESDSEDSDESLVDEGDLSHDEYGPMIDDAYNPYDQTVWDEVEDDEKGNYFSKLYRNGEVYNDQEFGKIEIKPWQLFTDKQHLRDVVRDYAIQSAFSVVVDKANNLRWTVTCSSPHCAWRLHASRLPDGCT